MSGDQPPTEPHVRAEPPPIYAVQQYEDGQNRQIVSRTRIDRETGMVPLLNPEVTYEGRAIAQTQHPTFGPSPRMQIGFKIEAGSVGEAFAKFDAIAKKASEEALGQWVAQATRQRLAGGVRGRS